MLTLERPGFFPQSGSTTLLAVDEKDTNTSFAVIDDFQQMWKQFAETGLNFMHKLSCACINSMMEAFRDEATLCQHALLLQGEKLYYLVAKAFRQKKHITRTQC